jgi:DMSO reductase iron-sulfur subunit
MQMGFVFDLNKCTGCSACQLACSIENNVSLPLNWRKVLTFNTERIPDLAFHHLSLACNHCIDPPCMKYCPSSAISKNTLTGAVLINSEKCIGCRYCSWVCPYDAPQFNETTGLMEKCTFCQHRLEEHLLPACVALCPTSALNFGEYMSADPPEAVAGFTQTEIKPALTLVPLRSKTSIMEDVGLPFGERTLQQFRENLRQRRQNKKINWLDEWPLIIFTALTAILIGLISARLLTGNPLIPDFLIPILAASGFIVSSLHLGKKTRAFRAIVNWRNSWLSREIAAYATFFLLVSTYFLMMPAQIWLGWLALLPGYYALQAMDNIYRVLPLSEPQKNHSAGALLTGLYVAAVLSGVLTITLLFGLTKLFLYSGTKIRSGEIFQPAALLFILVRILAGFFLPVAVLSGIFSAGHLAVFFGLVVAELIDRSDFYRALNLITPDTQMSLDFKKHVAQAKSMIQP